LTEAFKKRFLRINKPITPYGHYRQKKTKL